MTNAAETHPNSFMVFIERENYDEEAGEFIDILEWILCDLNSPEEMDEEGIRHMISSLETLLRDAPKPRVGRYGEQEIRGIVTKLKSYLHVEVRAYYSIIPINRCIYRCVYIMSLMLRLPVFV